MNDSISPTSPAWPTRWPRSSFTGVWTWLLAAIMTALIVVVLVAGLRTAATLNGGGVRMSPRLFDLGLILQIAFEAPAVLLILFALPKLARMPLRALGFRAPSARTLGIALLGAIAMVVVADGLASAIDLVLHSSHQQSAVLVFKDLHDPLSIGLLSVYAIVLAPFFEETVFRLFFFNLGLRYGGFWTGALLSGILFGAAHGDAYAAVPLALGGMILCAVYYRSRNAWASMVTHGIFNALSIAALFFFPHLVT